MENVAGGGDEGEEGVFCVVGGTFVDDYDNIVAGGDEQGADVDVMNVAAADVDAVNVAAAADVARVVVVDDDGGENSVTDVAAAAVVFCNEPAVYAHS